MGRKTHDALRPQSPKLPPDANPVIQRQHDATEQEQRYRSEYELCRRQVLQRRPHLTRRHHICQRHALELKCEYFSV